LQLLAQSSAPLFISAQPEALGEKQKLAIRNSFAAASHKQPLGEPRDWMNNPRPELWILNGETVHFDWS
jgi:alpha-galactosidase